MKADPILQLINDIHQGGNTDVNMLFEQMKDNGMELIREPFENYDMNSLSDAIDNMISTYLRVKFNYTYTQIRELIEKYPKQLAYLVTMNLFYGIYWDNHFFKKYDITLVDSEPDKTIFRDKDDGNNENKTDMTKE